MIAAAQDSDRLAGACMGPHEPRYQESAEEQARCQRNVDRYKAFLEVTGSDS